MDHLTNRFSFRNTYSLTYLFTYLSRNTGNPRDLDSFSDEKIDVDYPNTYLCPKYFPSRSVSTNTNVNNEEGGDNDGANTDDQDLETGDDRKFTNRLEREYLLDCGIRFIGGGVGERGRRIMTEPVDHKLKDRGRG